MLDGVQPMKVAALVEEIEARFEDLPVRNAQAMRGLRREYSKLVKALQPRDVVRIAGELIARGRVHRFFGDELIANHPGAFATLDPAQLVQLGSGISSWDQVDSFACILSGPAWREGRIEDRAIEQWAKSEDRWWRRAALVSTVPLNIRARGGRGDTGRTLLICTLLISDRDEMVVKALSWALRALVARDPKAVRRFISRNKDRLAALVRREVLHKLATGRKNPKRPRLKAGD